MHQMPLVTAVWLSAVFFYGCASAPSRDRQAKSLEATPSVTRQLPTTHYWSSLRFRFARDAQGEAQSFLDPLVADQVLAPVLDAYAAEIDMWRFHRRWPRDETGHQFSLIFYADAATAEAIVAAVKPNPVLERLVAEGLMREAVFETAFSQQRADLQATSDPIWSPDVQRQWPKFIEGASRMWLGMVKAQAERQPDQALLQRYRGVEDRLTQLWFEEANHAFLHHLSALFGYKPMRVIRRDVMTF